MSLALRRRGVRVRGVDRSPSVLAAARRRGIVRQTTTNLDDGVRGARMVVLCVPVSEMLPCAQRLSRVLDRNTVISDVGSVKVPVVSVMRRILKYPRMFVGGHPMTGSERSGLAAADASLFRNRWCILTPTRETDPVAVARTRELWRRCGAKVMSLAPARHDRLAAIVSHLPHASAGVLVSMGLGGDAAALRMAAGSFIDATRVAESSPRMWEGIFAANRREVQAAVRMFSRELNQLSRLIARGNESRLRSRLFAAARMRARLMRARGKGA